MTDADVLAVLARADAAPSLPQLGGMARPGGVAIVTRTASAFATVAGGVAVGSVRRPPAWVERIPLVRGVVTLAYALRPLSRTRPWERLFLLAVLAVSIFGGTLLQAAATVALLACLFRGRTLFLHGAEHRAIAAAESRSLVRTWAGEAQPTRFARRCGTNFAALVLLLNAALWPLGAVSAVLAIVVTTEVWRLAQTRAAGVLLVPGLLLQRLTTREPTLAETRVALRAVAAVLDA